MIRRAALLLPGFAWLLLFVAAPAAILLAIALAEADSGVPPFVPPLSFAEGWPRLGGTFENFVTLVGDGYYWDAVFRAIWRWAIPSLSASRGPRRRGACCCWCC